MFTRASVITGLDYWTLKFSALKTVSMLSDDIYLPVELTMMTHHSHQSLHSSGASNSKVHAGIPHFCPADPLSHLCHQWRFASFYHPHHLSTIHTLSLLHTNSRMRVFCGGKKRPTYHVAVRRCYRKFDRSKILSLQ